MSKTKFEETKQDQNSNKAFVYEGTCAHMHFLTWLKNMCLLAFFPLSFFCLIPYQHKSMPRQDREMSYFTFRWPIYHFELTFLFPLCICISFSCCPQNEWRLWHSFHSFKSCSSWMRTYCRFMLMPQRCIVNAAHSMKPSMWMSTLFFTCREASGFSVLSAHSGVKAWQGWKVFVYECVYVSVSVGFPVWFHTKV